MPNGTLNARCLHCGEVVTLDGAHVHVFPYRRKATVVDFSKSDEVKNGEVVRGMLHDCKLSVDYEVVAQKR